MKNTDIELFPKSRHFNEQQEEKDFLNREKHNNTDNNTDNIEGSKSNETSINDSLFT